MKKSIIGLFAFAILVNPTISKSEEPLLEWPKVPYPTSLIGQFMGFCNKTMNNMAAVKDPTLFSTNPLGAAIAHAQVCGCIMDSFRLNNSEFTFKSEFQAPDRKNVPFFSKYFDQCTQINNNLQFLKSGT